MDKTSVLLSIDEAFCNAPRPELSLRQYLLTDQKGMSGTITEEEWRLAGVMRVDSSWQEISDLEIEHCGGLMAHMDAISFKYYLPAYMRYSLNHIDKSVVESDILGYTVFSLVPWRENPEYSKTLFSLLDSTQRESISCFLRFVAEHADELERPDAVRALNYWAV